MLTIILLYLGVGGVLAHGRAEDIAVDAADQGIPVTVAKWVLTWPMWCGR
jgi:hypothetical protein